MKTRTTLPDGGSGTPSAGEPAREGEREVVRAEPAEHDDRGGEEPGYGYGV